ncbi:MAG: bifunctional metallophosphatase/5'-nucleotidase [Bacteroidales bacterium]|nr:bifunctional metallophosphatase/5'-nucleotidase [Bacteroidales bacterium]
MKNLIYFLFIVGASIFISCENNNNSTGNGENTSEDSLVNIIVFYTNDEHGWMEPTNDYDGAAGLMNMWKSIEGYDGSDKYLILSGGDMWTGPAISTWFQGESMVEVMNAMEYDVSAIGNHEFDFKIEGLNTRLEQMNFPLISANIKNRTTGEIPDFAKPYIIKEIEGVKVGIIGLSSLSTPYTTAPVNVADFEFTSYSEAIAEYSVKAKNEGAEVLILAGHICEYEMEELASVAKANGICIIGGGHCHQVVAKELNGVVLIQARSNMRAYAKVEFDYNKTTGETINFDYKIVWNNVHNIDSDIQDIVDYWIDQTEDELSEIIGYADETIFRSSTEMSNMVCDSWFYTFPNADVSLTNSGGIRQDIFQGDITLESMVGLLPFENIILELNITGAELIDVVDDFLVGGMTTVDGFKLMDGTSIHTDSTYTVLTTDYLYSLSDNNFSVYDEEPMNTSIHYRQPLIDWIKSLNTSVTNPLNNYLDHNPRR